MNKEELIKYFNFEDLVYRNPNYEPYISLLEHVTLEPVKPGKIGLYNEFIGHSSYMVNVDLKDRAFAEIEYQEIGSAETGYFDKDETGERKYISGESWEHGPSDGLIVEPLFVERSWPGLSMSCIEPCQRMIRYLNLKEKDGNWIDPYNEDVVIIKMTKETTSTEGIIQKTQKLEVKIDYLKDYLAARRSGLYMARYSSRAFLFDTKDEVPISPEKKALKNEGLWSFIINTDSTLLSMFAKGKVYAEAELRQKFWIEPLSKPRRWDAGPPAEFKGSVSFVLQDGTKNEYDTEAGHSKDYFKILSFSPRIMEIFIKRKLFDYEEYSRETRSLEFPTGECLGVAINPSGQIQVFWGQLAKLDKEYQKLLAPYSEAMLEKLRNL